MKDVVWIKQEHERGCGIAALAMLTGQSYAEVAAYWHELLQNDYQYEYTRSSPIQAHMDEYLALHGLAIARRYIHPVRKCDAEWTPEPFGAIHLCNVKVCAESPCNHWVVMLKDGEVLDPLTPDPRTLKDYYQVNNVAAVVSI